MACGAVANIVKSSLGPVGLDKISCALTSSQEDTKLRGIMALVLVLITYVLVTSRYLGYRSSQNSVRFWFPHPCPGTTIRAYVGLLYPWRTMHANSALIDSLLPDRVWPVFLRFPKISSYLSSHRRRCSHGRHWHRRGREGKKRSDQAQGWRAQQEVGVEAIKQKQQSLSLEAHDYCVNAIPDLSNMIKAVQGLVAQCEDLKLKCYEEMDKRKKLYNIVQETKEKTLHGLQNQAKKKDINCDATLKSLFGGRDKVGMLEISKLLSPDFQKISKLP
ncbi:hypothetical protein ZEAMMB73_Zm00001d026105 [Zea mays]|uniref:Uncharacterized protein n=1 Tax=Zea mays TaxID=4577 RepID=A0A1D6JCB8_MAIZE|nr:hypothetical protein ZEAMMB73_Zm00001d026105 [Zea mays]